MPGLVPGIHVFLEFCGSRVDGRDKPGHDVHLFLRRARYPKSRSTASTALRSSAVKAACGGIGSPTA